MALPVARSITLGFAAAWLAVSATALAQQSAAPKLDVHFVPTPMEVVERMLDMAKVTKDDFVIDLGSGDGRIVIAAAKRGARGLGVDLDPQRIKEARENAKRENVEDLVEFRQENLFDTNLSKATVITMYLLPRLNLQLRPELLKLKPGIRLASHSFDMGDWMADRHDKVDGRNAYFWIVPAYVSGRWHVQDGEQKFEIELSQRYQKIEGSATFGTRTVPLRETDLRGDTIRFVVEADNGELRQFRGRVVGDRIEAAPADAGAGPRPATNWQASRTL